MEPCMNAASQCELTVPFSTHTHVHTYTHTHTHTHTHILLTLGFNCNLSVRGLSHDGLHLRTLWINTVRCSSQDGADPAV